MIEMVVAYAVERYPVLSQTFVSNEIDELRRQGVDVVVATLRPGDAVGHDGVATFAARERHGSRAALLGAHARAALLHPLRYAGFLRVVRALGDERRQIVWRRLPLLARALDARGVDRLHAHFAWGGAALAAALSALTGWPWAMTMHARDIFTDRRNLDLKLRTADLLVTVCDYNVDYLRSQLGVERPIAKVVCGVQVPEVTDTAPSVDIACVGRLVEKKGVDLLLRAVAKLTTERPDLTVHVIGDGPLDGELRALAASLGLAGHVQFVGALPHDDVLDEISRARILCLPARVAADGDVDSMPLVCKEAMAREVAVVAGAVGGVPEMLADGAGWLVTPDDDDALASALRALLADDDARRALARAGRRRAIERLTLAGEVGKLRGLLEELGQTAPSPRRAASR